MFDKIFESVNNWIKSSITKIKDSFLRQYAIFLRIKEYIRSKSTDFLLIMMFLLAFIILYNYFSRIQTKDIYIELERIDPFALKQDASPDPRIMDANSAYVYFSFPLNDNIRDLFSSSYNIFTHCIPNNRVLKRGERPKVIISSPNDNFDQKNIDSLLNVYQSFFPSHPELKTKPLFHQIIYTSCLSERKSKNDEYNTPFKKKRVFTPHNTPIEQQFSISRYYKTRDSNRDKIWSCYEEYGDILNIKHIHGVFKEPGFFDLYNISECYYRIVIRTYRINHLELNFNFLSDNEFSFVDIMPDSICGQKFLYSFQNDDIKDGIKKELLFRVKSKELEGKQSIRMFIVTAALSACIALLLSLILNIYKIYFGDEPSPKKKNKHRKYKSRNSSN